MFVVVAVKTEQFPVAAIARVIVVIVILVMHRQLAHVLPCELSGAAAADPRVDLQGLLPVTGFSSLPAANGLGNHSIGMGTFFVGNGHGGSS